MVPEISESDFPNPHDYRTIKLGIETWAIPTVQLGPRRMIPRVPALRAFGVDM